MESFPTRRICRQRGGNLWLSEVIGAELIILSYNAVTSTTPPSRRRRQPVDRWGTGLVLDHTRIVTNKHGLTGLAGNSSGLSVYPSRDRADAEANACASLARIPIST